MHTPLPATCPRRVFTTLVVLAAFPLRVWAQARPAATGSSNGTDEPAQPPGIVVPTDQLQTMVGQRFPLRYPVPGLFNLDVKAPTLRLLPAQNRLMALMVVQASGPALNASRAGEFDVDFALRYEPSDRTIRANQLRLQRLHVQGFRAEAQALLGRYGPAMAEQALQEVVLHQLSAQDLATADRMGMQPTTITVTEEGLVIGLTLKPL